CDRWQVCYRLQDLDIPCDCLSDGSLQVEINNLTAALQLRSVVQQMTESRQQLADRLEQCWKAS
ncbi:MAG TPA: Asr1405/Asl0597 family protein, partial [Allocoleopsis sp.]